MQFRSVNVNKQKLTYPLCERVDHPNEPMNYICLERKCKSKGLLCSICRMSNHDNHNIISLRVFLDHLASTVPSEKNKADNGVLCLQQLQSTYFRMLGHLKLAVERLADQIKCFEQQLISYYNVYKDRIIDQHLITKNLENIMELIQDSDDCVEVMKIEMKKIANLVVFDKNINKYVVEYFPEKLAADFTRQESVIDKTLNSVCDMFDVNIKALKYQLTKDEASFVESFKFSSTLKAKPIFAEGIIARQTQSNSQDLRFAIIEPSIPLNKPSKISFNIHKCANWVGLGICIKETICAKNYKFTYNTIGHGSYMASSNGYIWSHSRAEDNLKNKSFSFTTNDVVTVQFDPVAKKITYLSGANKFEQEVNFDVLKDTIHFCANLCSQNDEVRIKNEVPVLLN